MHHCYDINAIGQAKRAALEFLRCFAEAGNGMADERRGASAEGDAAARHSLRDRHNWSCGLVRGVPPMPNG
jgi:hypothetical protein